MTGAVESIAGEDYASGLSIFRKILNINMLLANAHAYQPCFIARPNSATGSVFSTSSFVSQARRACVIP